MIIVDASAIVDLILARPQANAIAERLFTGSEKMSAPHLIDPEVVQTLRRFWKTGELAERRAIEALAFFDLLPIRRYSHELYIQRIWALRDNLTAYDAIYVALAERLDAPLLTRDARLARSRGHGARIEYID